MPWTGAAHAVFDRLVYRKVRQALGGNLRLAFSGGAPLGERLTHFFAGIGLDIYEGYGLTETGPTLTVNRPGAWKPGTVGRPVAGTSIRSPPTVRSSPRGRRSSAGYWHNPTATAEAFDDAAGSSPATSASSTTTGSCGSPAGRRSSSSRRPARTWPRPRSRTASVRTS